MKKNGKSKNKLELAVIKLSKAWHRAGMKERHPSRTKLFAAVELLEAAQKAKDLPGRSGNNFELAVLEWAKALYRAENAEQKKIRRHRFDLAIARYDDAQKEGLV